VFLYSKCTPVGQTDKMCL